MQRSLSASKLTVVGLFFSLIPRFSKSPKCIQLNEKTMVSSAYPFSLSSSPIQEDIVFYLECTVDTIWLSLSRYQWIAASHCIKRLLISSHTPVCVHVKLGFTTE